MQALIKGRKDVCFIQLGSMFTLFFCENLPQNMDEVGQCDFDRFGRFFQYMIANNVLIPPSQYEANFFSAEHTSANVDHYVTCLENFLLEDK